MEQTKSAFVALVGRPNVGKSTLLNALVGEKIAIISNKPQTTRTRITGVLTKAETQLVFIDTPGLHKPRTKLSEYMVKQVNESVADVDVAILVTEPYGNEIYKAELELMESFKRQKIPAILVINKIDTLSKKEELMQRIALFSEAYEFDAVIPISAFQEQDVAIVLEEIMKYAEEGPHFFPDDMLTDQPERLLVAEIIREKILHHLYDEIPHGTAVSIEKMSERESGNMMDIHATIFCERNSHKGMIIGKNGALLKQIASEARLEIESFLGIRVNLQCWVKVKDDWRNREGIIKTLGFS
ncbi:GTPase Era [Candidatus Soleaferrea massiliensis]|uniref:GTPase Era n=1 Tax=Candidatus Soleaferrea massiliensis TaxID=1470354 RepID=UPI0005915947|nr:GTPase Era [Candidatus Soleaferrea massiliensis]